MLYEVAVLLKPTRADAEEGKLEEMVITPRFIIAQDEQSASLQIIVDNTAVFDKWEKSRLQVLIRPF